MKRIAVIFSVAGALALSALVIGRKPMAAVTPPTPPIAVVAPPTTVVTPPATVIQPPSASNSGSIIMTTRLSDPLLALGGDRDEYLKIDLQGVDVAGQRAPVNLAVVLDRSGSMAGEKLESARRAAHTLVDRLNEKDRLAFITFGSNVTPLFPSELCTPVARGEMHRAIDRIYDMGGTNLSGGLEAGLREVQAHQEGYSVNRVILISDGEANEGITSRAGLAAITRGALRRHVSVSSFGVGADFDEDTMEQLAENGGGNYRFLATGAELEPIFNSELKQLSTAVAASPSVTLQLPAGVQVVEVFGYTSEQSGSALTIRLPDFAAGEHRKIVAQLRVPANALGASRVSDVKLDYLDLLHDKRAVETVVAADATVVPSEAQASAERDRETYAQVARVHAAYRAKRAATFYSAGDVNQAQAELQGARDDANKLNAIAQDATLGADLDRIAPAAAPAPRPSSEEGRAAAKAMKQNSYDAFR